MGHFHFRFDERKDMLPNLAMFAYVGNYPVKEEEDYFTTLNDFIDQVPSRLLLVYDIAGFLQEKLHHALIELHGQIRERLHPGDAEEQGIVYISSHFSEQRPDADTELDDEIRYHGADEEE